MHGISVQVIRKFGYILDQCNYCNLLQNIFINIEY